MGRIKEYFVEHGLTVADIPKAIILHEAVSIAFAMATWTVCYSAQPVRSIAKFMPKKSTPGLLAKGYTAALAGAHRQVDKMKWLAKLPGSDIQRLTTSCAESMCFRGAIKPVTIPGKLWVSWKLVMMTKLRKCHEEASAHVTSGKV
eukprot:CAMPEP_0114237902 /NCGR_PEP_ID=MMETSP0058-20121206/7640_1 /TAXON_ID=36894 /ORGANISM="Pyramimonas parkeae, CCMP726" /LENGTH=145 /DNA_ID=CAMNT_0001349979 /DNA_START=232 /DNA_END=669 /DNA_ORIENTATION=+